LLESRAALMKRYPRAVLLLALIPALSLAGPPAPAGTQTGEETAVLAVMDRYLAAISAKDVTAMAAMQTPDGMTYRARAVDGGAWDVVARPNSYWVDPSKVDAHSHREVAWSPTVLVRGAIAVVWAPYEFWIDGKTSHCGIDVFDFVKIDGAWRVSNAAWTVEPNACQELRPAHVPALQAQGAESASACNAAWYRSIEAKVPTGDGQGHGPDVGSDEWKSVVEFKLGIRGDPAVPSRDSEAWCRYIDQIVR
jgi:hypothetical protein